MNTQEIVQKLWNLCNVLRDDGITYHQYLTELTYILFLKMAKETDKQDDIPPQYRWDELVKLNGMDLHNFYRRLLLDLGEQGRGLIKQIYANAKTNIDEPKNLEKIIKSIDRLDWYERDGEMFEAKPKQDQWHSMGDLYEGLLEKNASEKKSGAGQYFTPRPLINVMVRLIDPQPGERCNDPACGTFGFMIAAFQHIYTRTHGHYDLPSDMAEFQVNHAFTGCELVADAHRLALMNELLHGLNGEILLADTLSAAGKQLKHFDVVLTNPPFGTKKGGERPTRDDLTFASSNKQLNFLQHVYRSLNKNGRARAAIVVPDNVLFQDGDGQSIRADLMDKCRLDAALRLPTGIFYAQGVKTNVLFFTRGQAETGNTQDVWFYDLRTNMPTFGQTNKLTEADFQEFEATFHAPREEKARHERWSVFTREAIRARGESLDLGLIRDESVVSHEELPDPVESAEVAVANLEQAADLLNEVIQELRSSRAA